MRQMMKSIETGEIMVVETTTHACTPTLMPEEQNEPLDDYELDVLRPVRGSATMNPFALTLPCGHRIDPVELLSLAGRYRASLRLKRTPGAGRPRTLERCACGHFTVKRIPKGHVCLKQD